MFSKDNKSILKIAVITPVFPYPKSGVLPGVESYVKSFTLPLKILGHNVRIITTYWNGGPKFDYYKGIPIFRILDTKALFGKLGSVFYLNHITFGLNLLLKKHFRFFSDSDLLIIPLAIGFTNFFKIKKIPVITTFLHYDSEKSLIDYLTLPFYHFLEKKQFKRHRKILTISNSSRIDVMRFYGVNKKNIKVIPIGVDIEEFNPSNFSKEIKEKYGNNLLLYVGPFLKRKRIPLLLEAMTNVIKVIPEAHLVLIGKGLLLEESIKLSYSLGLQQNTSFLGFIEIKLLLKFYASSDIFILPSELEGFGQVLLESMASGTPCICANKKPMSEILGDTGETFKINDSKDLADKILDLLNNREKLEILREKTLKRAQRFEWVRIAQDYINYFKEVIQNNT